MRSGTKKSKGKYWKGKRSRAVGLAKFGYHPRLPGKAADANIREDEDPSCCCCCVFLQRGAVPFGVGASAVARIVEIARACSTRNVGKKNRRTERKDRRALSGDPETRTAAFTRSPGRNDWREHACDSYGRRSGRICVAS